MTIGASKFSVGTLGLVRGFGSKLVTLVLVLNMRYRSSSVQCFPSNMIQKITLMLLNG